ncbi:MAG: hypothetical protein NT166_09975 [Candidatus Aminicenantes bacterium]|nr:hypothetical protein [Candidatus Aminicenantes bacterium]
MKFQNWCTIGICCFLIQCFVFAGGHQKAIALKDIYKTGKIEFVPVLKISKDSLPADIPFKGIYSSCRIHDRLYLLDTDCSNIKVFTADGRFLKTFGKEGRSESELNVPNRMNVIDGQLVVWEIGTRRFSIFNTDGEFKHTLQPFKKGFVDNFDSPGNGNLVIERTGYSHIGDDVYNAVSIELYSKNFQLIKVLYQKLLIQSRIFKTPGKDPVYLPLPFQPKVSWDILPGNDGKNSNKLVIGCSDAYSIDIIDTETGKSRTFTTPYSPVRVNEADRIKYFESFNQYDKDGNVTVQGADQFMRDNTAFPEYKPVFKRVIADCEGNILIFTYTDSDNGKFSFFASEFDAFDSDGQFINHVKIANDAEISLIQLFSEKGFIFWGRSAEKIMPIGFTKYTVN